MALRRFGIALAAAALCLSEADDQALFDAALGGDDECTADSGCALNALQRRAAQRADPARTPAETTEAAEGGAEEGKVVDDLPAGWNATDDVNDTTDDALDAGGAVVKPMYDHYVAVNCQRHPEVKQCLLYRYCHGPRYCVMGGYMIVPGFFAAGMESINGGNARSFDYLFDAAHRMCGHPGCVLITNPVGFRTQNQLHIHFKHLSGGGFNMRKSLEHELCDSIDGHWHYYHKCGTAKAAIFGRFPGVFSSVASAFGGRSLASVGIAVFQTSSCGRGQQTIVLATTHCSIEHEIA